MYPVTMYHQPVDNEQPFVLSPSNNGLKIVVSDLAVGLPCNKFHEGPNTDMMLANELMTAVIQR